MGGERRTRDRGTAFELGCGALGLVLFGAGLLVSRGTSHSEAGAALMIAGAALVLVATAGVWLL
jgi:hypothetical protein